MITECFDPLIQLLKFLLDLGILDGRGVRLLGDCWSGVKPCSIEGFRMVTSLVMDFWAFF